jgi:hypothetical protein
VLSWRTAARLLCFVESKKRGAADVSQHLSISVDTPAIFTSLYIKVPMLPQLHFPRPLRLMTIPSTRYPHILCVTSRAIIPQNQFVAFTSWYQQMEKLSLPLSLIMTPRLPVLLHLPFLPFPYLIHILAVQATQTSPYRVMYPMHSNALSRSRHRLTLLRNRFIATAFLPPHLK